jgi:Holliday junction resolvasome RuvABC endonuclease subunit
MVGTDPTEYKGFEDSFRRGVMLYEGFRAVLLPRLLESGPLLLAHETPSVPTAKTRRTDVGLISCMALRCAAASLGMPTPLMLQAQKIRTTLCGTSAATKKDIREVVKKTVQLNQGLRYLNNNTYDAMAIAIIAAERNGNG